MSDRYSAATQCESSSGFRGYEIAVTWAILPPCPLEFLSGLQYVIGKALRYKDDTESCFKLVNVEIQFDDRYDIFLDHSTVLRYRSYTIRTELVALGKASFSEHFSSSDFFKDFIVIDR